MTQPINPTVLKRARKKKGLTQTQLASAIGCEKDTVSRWERGVSRHVRSHLRPRLSEALGVPWAELTREEVSGGRNSRMLNVRVDTGTRNALDLVCKRYGVTRSLVIDLAPLLFLIVAERSLIERKRRLEQVERQIDEASQSLNDALPHFSLFLTPRNECTFEPLAEEQESVRRGDIFGELVRTSSQAEGDDGNPFLNYLRVLTEGLPGGAVASLYEFDDREFEYVIAVDTLEQLTDLDPKSETDLHAMHAIWSGSIDLLECIRVRQTETADSYHAWIEGELAAADERLQSLLKELSIRRRAREKNAMQNGGEGANA